jgi:hypothetical protein
MPGTYATAAGVENDRAQPLLATRVELAVTGDGARARSTRCPTPILVEGCRCSVFDACRALLAHQ